jgi:LysR family transcriptional regulator for metE and metH
MSNDGLPKLDMRDLRMVAAIATHGGLTRAAPHVNATQSGLSHQLKDLESRLGVTLFDRAGRRMVPTAAGERLAASAETILRSLLDTENDVLGVQRTREARIRIATECYTCYYWLPALIRRYADKFPRVEIQVIAEATDDPFHAMLAGALDVCVSCTEVRDQRLRAQFLFDDELVVCMAPDHALASRDCVQPADLAGEHIYVYSPLEVSSVYQTILRPAGVSAAQLSRVTLTEATIELVKAGLGIAFLARWAVEPHLRAKTLRAVPYGQHGTRRTWSVVTRVQQSTPVHQRAFVAYLRRALRGPRGTTPPFRTLCNLG